MKRVNNTRKEREMFSTIKSLAYSKKLELAIISVIIIQAIVLGLETVPDIYAAHHTLFEIINWIVISIFIIEAVLKIASHAPQPGNYFKDGWNIFDFSIIILSLLPFTHQFSTIARLARLLRVVRLVSALKELRIMAATLVRSIPSMINILLLLSILFYIYGIAGYHLFHTTDPQNWGSLGSSLLTLFKIVTLEGWIELMEAVTVDYPLAWLYFISFIILGTFIVINLFIAVVIENLGEAKDQIIHEIEETAQRSHHNELLSEIAATKKSLEKLEEKIKRIDVKP